MPRISLQPSKILKNKKNSSLPPLTSHKPFVQKASKEGRSYFNTSLSPPYFRKKSLVSGDLTGGQREVSVKHLPSHFPFIYRPLIPLAGGREVFSDWYPHQVFAPCLWKICSLVREQKFPALGINRLPPRLKLNEIKISQTTMSKRSNRTPDNSHLPG